MPEPARDPHHRWDDLAGWFYVACVAVVAVWFLVSLLRAIGAP